MKHFLNEKNHSTSSLFDAPNTEDIDELNHRKQIRKMLERHLEQKRLKEEIDELDGEFDWNDIE